MYCRRLPLEGICNARDLGGFFVPDGVTKFGIFLRSDVPSILSADDICFLKNYGLKNVMDLRSSDECAAVPDVLSLDKSISYINVPMYDKMAAKGTRSAADECKPFSWADHYIRMVEENKLWVLNVLSALEKAQGCTLIHCATGKDRTGLVAMVLLGLCGVSDEDIIADYSVSQIYLKPLYEKLIKDGASRTLSDPCFSTAPENMALLLTHINSVYGGIPSYLKTCGVSDDLIASLRKRLFQDT